VLGEPPIATAGEGPGHGVEQFRPAHDERNRFLGAQRPLGGYLDEDGNPFDFGRLPTTDMRWPLVGMLAIVAGSQIALVSFLLSLTRIGENETPAPAAPTPSATDVPYVRT